MSLASVTSADGAGDTSISPWKTCRNPHTLTSLSQVCLVGFLVFYIWCFMHVYSYMNICRYVGS